MIINYYFLGVMGLFVQEKKEKQKKVVARSLFSHIMLDLEKILPSEPLGYLI